MEKYISRRYLREKWERLKWDIEKTLDIYEENTETDKISVKDAQCVKHNIQDMMEAIKKELGF